MNKKSTEEAFPKACINEHGYSCFDACRIFGQPKGITSCLDCKVGDCQYNSQSKAL